VCGKFKRSLYIGYVFYLKTVKIRNVWLKIFIYIYIYFSHYVLSSFGLPLPPTSVVLTVSESRSYFASTIRQGLRENVSAFLTVLARTKVKNACARLENSEITLE